MNFFTPYQTFSDIFPEYLEERKIGMKHKTIAGDIGRGKRFNDWFIENGLDKKPLRKITNRDIRQLNGVGFKYPKR